MEDITNTEMTENTPVYLTVWGIITLFVLVLGWAVLLHWISDRIADLVAKYKRPETKPVE